MSSLRVRLRASVAVAFLVTLLAPPAPSIGGQRLTSTPAERLVGHWSPPAEEDFYTLIGANGRGRYTDVAVSSSGGTYKVVSQDKEGERVTIETQYPSGRKRDERTCVISKDGATMTATIILDKLFTIERHFRYVDDKLEPTSVGGGGERHLSTPAERLAGHWVALEVSHFYYSPIGPNGRGSYILVQENGKAGRHEYRIVSQDKKGERVTVELLFSTGDKRTGRGIYMISKDGATMDYAIDVGLPVLAKGRVKYVDDKVEPGSA